MTETYRSLRLSKFII